MKKIITTILVFLLVVFIALIACSQIVKRKREEIKISSSTTTSQVQVLYILSEYDGRLALFSSESEEPVTIFEIYTDSLPYDDYVLIKSGIKIESEEELQNLIEDYLS